MITDTCDTIADGLATRHPLEANVHAIRQLVDEVRLVSERELLGAIRLLVLDEHSWPKVPAQLRPPHFFRMHPPTQARTSCS